MPFRRQTKVALGWPRRPELRRARLLLVILLGALPALLLLLPMPVSMAAAPPQPPQPHAIVPVVVYPAASGTTPPLRELAARGPQATLPLATAPRATPRLRSGHPAQFDQAAPPGADPVRQAAPGSTASFTQVASFDGVSYNGYLPPDPNGDIGYDPATGHKFYFQWINVIYEAWDVTNPLAPLVVVPPTFGNTLWAAALPGSPCALHNHGDPIALFDEQAHRWLISQFSVQNPFHQCVAISQTADPSGAWYVYDYPYGDGVTYFNDYTKFGVWPDPQVNAYFMSADQFDASGSIAEGAGVAALDRARMLAGDPNAPMVLIDLYPVNPLFAHLLPADLDGTPPPAGTPGFFVAADNSAYIPGLGADALRVWEFRPDFAQPASSTFGVGGTPNYTLPVSAFSVLPCVMAFSSDCIQQPGITIKLDSLGDRAMYRAAFRTVGARQSLVVNHTVLADGIDRSGSRWYELRRDPAGGTWNIAQQSTYAPNDGIYRWMGSAAMDRQGDIALGYSASSLSLFPSIRYTGRLVSDTLNTLPQTELTLTTGGGAQSLNCGNGICMRWGDYTMMGVDPQDGCTFWYTNEYYITSGQDWHTRIGAFRFPQCAPQPAGGLTGTIARASNGSPISGSVVTAMDTSGVGTFVAAPTNANGQYSLSGIPAGTYTLTAAAQLFVTGTVAGVVVSNGLTGTQNLTLSALYGVSLAPRAATLTGSVGAIVTYTLLLSNTGSASDSYTITAGGNVWPASAPSSAGPIASGAATVITVGVTISPGALPGAQDSATITASSHGDPAQFASAILTTSVRVMRWYLPYAVR